METGKNKINNPKSDKKKVFFSRGTSIKEIPKFPLSYEIFIVYKENGETEECKWKALIKELDENSICNYSSIIIENLDEFSNEEDDINRKKLKGIIDTLEWIHRPGKFIKVEYITNDVYIVNMLREFIPFWKKENYIIPPIVEESDEKEDEKEDEKSDGIKDRGKEKDSDFEESDNESNSEKEEIKRPNYDLISTIGNFMDFIEIKMEWKSQTSFELSNLYSSL